MRIRTIITIIFIGCGVLWPLGHVQAAGCSPSQSGTVFTLTDNCSFSGSVDGVDTGTGTSNTAKLVVPTDKTLTIGNSQTLGLGSLEIQNGGTVIMPTGGNIYIGGPLWVDEPTDADSDGYPGTEGGGNTAVSYTQPGGKERENAYTPPGTLDCNDTSPLVYLSGSGYADSDLDTYTAGSSSYNCFNNANVALATKASVGTGSVDTISAGQVKASASGSDCNDSSALVYVSGSGYGDVDLDTYTTATASAYTCFNNASVGSATYGAVGTGTPVALSAGQVKASVYGKDCNDANGSLWGNCYGYVGSGLDGSVTFAANIDLSTTDSEASLDRNGSNPDMWATNVTAFSTTDGLTTATVADNPMGKIVVGDEVIVVNVQGTNTAYTNVGNWETFIVDATASGSVTFNRPKIRYYGSGASNDSDLGTTKGTNQIVILQRIPHYTDVTVNSGVYIYTGRFDQGVTKGVFALRASGTLTLNGYIYGQIRGYAGATQYGNRTYSGGGGGEAYCGSGGNGAAGCDAGSTSCSGIGAISTTGAAGGGGAYGYTYTASLPGRAGVCGGGGGGGGYNGSGGASGSSIGGSGGGGGGHGGGGGGAGYGTIGYGGGKGALSVATATNGGNGSGSQSGSGGNGATSSYGEGGGGGGGGTYGAADLSSLFFGSGGGRGGVYNGTPGSGGNGGGIVVIGVNTISANAASSLNAIAGTGGAASGGNAGGGGGGSGGSILIYGNSVTLGSNSTTAAGGSGSSYAGGSGGSGGNGGSGRIAIYSPNSITGSSTPSYSTAVSFATYSP